MKKRKEEGEVLREDSARKETQQEEGLREQNGNKEMKA